MIPPHAVSHCLNCQLSNNNTKTRKKKKKSTHEDDGAQDEIQSEDCFSVVASAAVLEKQLSLLTNCSSLPLRVFTDPSTFVQVVLEEKY